MCWKFQNAGYVKETYLQKTNLQIQSFDRNRGRTIF